jgi:molecular chaperone GrpE
MSKESESPDLIDEGAIPVEELAEELPEEQEAGTETARSGHSVSDMARALADQNDRYLRLAAEFDNYRRRTNKEKQEMGLRAQATLASTLLESLDDFARISALKPDVPGSNAFVAGVELVARKLNKALMNAGLEVVDPLDAKFDPQIHEAIAIQPATNAGEDDTVASVAKPGYLFKGQLLRPAQVVVKKWNG